MFKLKPPTKKLSLAIALALIAGTASANEITVYSTYKYLYDTEGNTLEPLPANGAEILANAEWAAGYFSVNSQACPNGCDITRASVQLDANYNSQEAIELSGVTLEIYSNQSGPAPENNLFRLDAPATVLFDGTFGTRIEFTAAEQDPNAPAILQPGEYWLKLTNVDQSSDLEWLYNGNDKDGEHWASSKYGTGSGAPFMFGVTGEARALSEVPIPGAVWLMGSALFGLLGAARRKQTEVT